MLRRRELELGGKLVGGETLNLLRKKEKKR